MSAFPDLVRPVYDMHAARSKVSPCHTNRASSLGEDCERRLVYDRTAWQHAQPPSLELQLIFEQGNRAEGDVLRDLQEAGLQVLEQQVALEWPHFGITGHLDAIVVHEGEAIPLDVKTMSPNIWGSCFQRGGGVYEWSEVSESFASKSWMRKYLAQLTIYALLKNIDRAMLLCIDKSTGQLAQVNVRVDFEYAEFLLQRAERINGYVVHGTLPPRIEFSEDGCPRCPFYAHCLPDQQGKDPLAFLSDATIEKLLEEREVKKDPGQEFARLDDQAKAWAKAREEDRIAIGNFLVVKKIQKNGVRVNIERIGVSTN